MQFWVPGHFVVIRNTHWRKKNTTSTSDTAKLDVYMQEQTQIFIFQPSKTNPQSIKDLTMKLETLRALEDVGSVLIQDPYSLRYSTPAV